MKKIFNFLFLLSLTICFSFCTNKNYTPADYPKGQITFGNGGGITGAVKEFTVLENGAMFSKANMGAEYEALKKIDSKMVDQLFNNIKFLKINDIQLNEPGNRYYFIQVKGKDTDHKITWGGGKDVPKNLTTFYNILNHLTKS